MKTIPNRRQSQGGDGDGWELHTYGLAEGYDKLVVSDIVALLIEALKGIGVADNDLLGAHIKARSHNPTEPGGA